MIVDFWTSRLTSSRFSAVVLPRGDGTLPDPMPLTAFRDPLPAGTSYPVGLERLTALLPERDFAVYFVATATWVRQYVPLDAERLPVLRVQTALPELRVGGELVAREAEGHDLHVLVYAVPGARRRAIGDALASLPKSWRAKSPDCLVLYHDAAHDLHIEHVLPPWL